MSAQQPLGIFVRLTQRNQRKADAANLDPAVPPADQFSLPIDRRRKAVRHVQIQFPALGKELRAAENALDTLHGRHVYVRMKQRHGYNPQAVLDVLGFHLMNSYATYEALHTIQGNNLKLFQFKPAVPEQRLVAASAVTGGVSYARPPEPETPTYFDSAPVAGPVSGEGHIVFPTVSAPCGELSVGRYDPVNSETSSTGNVRIRPHRNFSSRGVSRPTDLLPGRSVASAAQLAGAVTATPAVPASFSQERG